MSRKRIAVGAGLVVVALAVMVGTAFAQDAAAPAPATDAQIGALWSSTNLMWIVICAALVMFMQAGFAALETGFVRARNAAHTMSMNIAVFAFGFVGFFLTGFAFMFGGYSVNVPGNSPGYNFGLTTAVGEKLLAFGDTNQWVFLWKGPFFLSFEGVATAGGVLGFFLYMAAFMDTAATIPTGAMAERWKFSSFCLWGLFCGALYYPLFGAMTWGGGWLSQLGNSMNWGQGYTDFAGSGVVHAVGGVAALTGAKVLGARRGKYGKDGKPRGLPGHNIPLAGIGTLILMFGWIGFNAGSTLQVADGQFGVVAANSMLAAAGGCTAALLWVWMRTKKPDPAMIMNGLLAGLVAVTAPCAFVDPWAAMVIGLIAGVIVVEGVFFVDRVLKIDDPVGAIGVHFCNGVFGVLAVGIFANGKYGVDAFGPGLGWNLTTTHVGLDGKAGGVTGVLYGGTGGGQLLAQLAGLATIIVLMGTLSFLFFKLCSLLPGGIRSTEEAEIAGLDVPEMGILAYPEFSGTHESFGESESVGAGAKE